jgi:lipoprotein-anchoring transpeptidase ErfK/SrfK
MNAAQDINRAGRTVAPSALRRLVLLSATLLVAAATSGAAAATAPIVRPTQELVTLDALHTVRSAPHSEASSLASLPERRPITGVQTVLPVLAHAAGGWLQVRLPGRPNGSTGWISAHATTISVTPWHLLVDTPHRRVLVYRAGHLVKAFQAVVGKPSTPTPTGAFFVEEAVRLAPTDAGAPFALALSARSNVLQEFDGGPGQIALHGLANVGGTPGTAASHGCIRLDDNAMLWLVGRIGAGVPVTIR